MPFITMYVTHSCPHCRRALQFLARHQVGDGMVQVVFVDEDAAGAAAFHHEGFTGVPAFVSDGARWQGFDVKRLRIILGIHLLLPGDDVNKERGGY